MKVEKYFSYYLHFTLEFGGPLLSGGPGPCPICPVGNQSQSTVVTALTCNGKILKIYKRRYERHLTQNRPPWATKQCQTGCRNLKSRQSYVVSTYSGCFFLFSTIRSKICHKKFYNISFFIIFRAKCVYKKKKFVPKEKSDPLLTTSWR